MTAPAAVGRRAIWRTAGSPAPENGCWFPDADQDHHGRSLAAQVLEAHTRFSRDPRVAFPVEALMGTGPEFRSLWHGPLVTGPCFPAKRLLHPGAGELRLIGDVLTDPEQTQSLTVYTVHTVGTADGTGPADALAGSHLRALLGDVPIA